MDPPPVYSRNFYIGWNKSQCEYDIPEELKKFQNALYFVELLTEAEAQALFSQPTKQKCIRCTKKGFTNNYVPYQGLRFLCHACFKRHLILNAEKTTCL